MFRSHDIPVSPGSETTGTERRPAISEGGQRESSVGNLAEFRVVTADAEALGNVSGVLISPATRRCEFFVIASLACSPSAGSLLPDRCGRGPRRDDPKSLRLTARKDELDLQAFSPGFRCRESPTKTC